MKEESSDNLLAAYFDGSLTVEEQQQVEHSAATDASFRKELEASALVWRKSPAVQLFQRIEGHKDEDFKKVVQRLKVDAVHKIPRRRITLSTYFYKVAASITLIAMIGSAILIHRHVPGFGRWEAYSTQDKIEIFSLPDNTQVALNQYSRIIYLKNNDEPTRKVKLTGEAYFKVTSNPVKPFEVQAGPTQISVLGTQFNVKLAGNHKTTEVNVTEGKVQFSGNKHSIILHAGETGKFEHGKLAKKSYKAPNFLYWRNKELLFNNSSLAEIIETLAANFQEIQTINYKASPSSVNVTTKFQNQSLESIFDELELHFNKKFELKDGVLTISD